ncbi:unnamed protein product [Gulo gulo]|uniref:Uncharacterized protein n=1 Tax=Gulo gulo TaxID=48420 RepID=A0A9X9Q1V0_GULGU|nr:unnamed protein product [Gulo gulo]
MVPTCFTTSRAVHPVRPSRAFSWSLRRGASDARVRNLSSLPGPSPPWAALPLTSQPQAGSYKTKLQNKDPRKQRRSFGNSTRLRRRGL